MQHPVSEKGRKVCVAAAHAAPVNGTKCGSRGKQQQMPLRGLWGCGGEKTVGEGAAHKGVGAGTDRKGEERWGRREGKGGVWPHGGGKVGRKARRLGAGEQGQACLPKCVCSGSSSTVPSCLHHKPCMPCLEAHSLEKEHRHVLSVRGAEGG